MTLAGFPLLKAVWLQDAMIWTYRMTLAAVLGAFLAYGRARAYLAAYALIALCAAIYVSVFHHPGVSNNALIHEIVDAALWIGLTAVAALAWLWSQRRLRECYTMVCTGVAVLCGILIGFGVVGGAVVLVSTIVLANVAFHYVCRQT